MYRQDVAIKVDEGRQRKRRNNGMVNSPNLFIKSIKEKLLLQKKDTEFMKNRLFALTGFVCITLLHACNLEKEVAIDLPDYKIQPVVECYLEPGKPPVLLLTQSTDFFAPFDTSLIDLVNRIILEGATVVVKYDGISDTLRNNFYFDPNTGRLFNYVGDREIAYKPGTRYDLAITLKDGNTIAAQCVMPLRTPIDSVVVEWDPKRDTLARALTYITDDRSQTQYWRRVLNVGSLTDTIPDQDFLVRDDLNQTTKIAFGTAYEFVEGDTIFNTIYSVTEDHLNFVESVQVAVLANINPFASPSAIKSNVAGTSNPLGIFAPVVYDRDTTFVRK
jgi:Domain of unknown function (DUF4249)